MNDETQRDPDAAKTTCMEILAHIRDLHIAGKSNITVFDIHDFLLGVPYMDKKRRQNDASQRLRKLERSGYIAKITTCKKTAERPEEAAASVPTDDFGPDNKPKRGRGRPAASYAITKKGTDYARTIADIYLLETGEIVDRPTVSESLKASILMIGENQLRIIVATQTQEGASAGVEAWMKASGERFKAIEVGPVVLPKEEDLA